MKKIQNIDKMKNFLLNILFPLECLNCMTKNEILCEYCIRKIRKAEATIDKNIIAIFDYKDPIIKKAIWQLKYYHRRYLGEKLGNILYEHSIENISFLKTMSPDEPIYVIPVPISKKRTKFRGYNQSKMISKGFCNSSEDKILKLKNNIITKTKETIPQAKITNRNKRLKNIQGVFKIKNPKIVKGKVIIVIDDVTTTGGTIKEIIKILNKAKAKKVVGFALAH